MDTPKPHIAYTVVVEGKYDKIKLDSIIDAHIITTGGFALFNDSQKLSLIRRVAEAGGKIILLTDPDGGGTQIRSYLTRCLSPDKIIQLYVPRVRGKEKRKSAPSKSGTLGVEGIDADTLRALFAPYAAVPCADEAQTAASERRAVTKADFYEYGLSGCENSSSKRDALAEKLRLPTGLTANALLAAVNAVCGYDGFIEAAEKD